MRISDWSSDVCSSDLCVVKFANVNGSGSASANELFARSILRMGVPVSPRNIFPSNIQGLPTWYEVRVSEDGYLGRRGGIDMIVAMNPETWARSEEHTSELQSLMRISYAVFCLKKKNKNKDKDHTN